MGKKSTDKLSPAEIRRKKRKRFMRKLKKNLFTLLLIAVAIGAYKPELNPVVQLDPYFNQLHALIFERENTSMNAPQIDMAWLDTTRDRVLGMTQNITVPKAVSGLPEDVVVEEAINIVASEVKKLPQKQIDKIKVNICQEIIRDATQSATQ